MFYALPILAIWAVPSRSETLAVQFEQFTRKCMLLLFTLFGLGGSAPAPQVAVKPVAPQIASVPKHPHMVSLGAPEPLKDDGPNSMTLQNIGLRHYRYVFEGKATHAGKACPNASIIVHLVSGDEALATQGAVTNPDGTYSLAMEIDASPNKPVDWSMEAYSADFKKVEMVGRRILTQEESPNPAMVKNAVVFAVPLSDEDE